MRECDNSKIHISSNFVFSVCLLIMLRQIPQERRSYVTTSTNISVYPTLFLYYESGEITLNFDQTLYSNSCSKPSEQYRLNRSQLSLFPVVTGIFCFFSSTKANCPIIPNFIAVSSSSQDSAPLVGKHCSPYFSFMG